METPPNATEEKTCVCDQKCPMTEDHHWIDCPAHAYYAGYLEWLKAREDAVSALDSLSAHVKPSELKPDAVYHLPTPETIEAAIAQRNAWVETAGFHSLNEFYYRDLLTQIAQTLGVDAYTADDGTVYDSPVHAKLPDLCQALVAKLSQTASDRRFIMSAVDFSDAGPDKFKPGYDQYRDLAVVAKRLVEAIPGPIWESEPISNSDAAPVDWTTMYRLMREAMESHPF